MADLVVNTAELDAAAARLREVAAVCEESAQRGGRLAAMVPALGADRAAQAASSFLSCWAYGVGWIRAQSADLAELLTTASAAYTAAEAMLAVAAGADSLLVTPAPVSMPRSAPEPVRANWTLLASSISPVPVQLATATHVSQLIPGDPEQVAAMARGLVRFAESIGRTRSALTQVAFGGWVGAAAEMAEQQILQLLRRLAEAEAAFAQAGDAVTRYAGQHEYARTEAAKALAIWQTYEHAAAVARGAAVAQPGAVLPVGVDPVAELARAAAILASAREVMDTAARALATILKEAEEHSPNDPGWFSAIVRGVKSFSVGVAQGVVGMGEGIVTMAQLGVQLDPARAMYDPHGYLATLKALGTGILHVGANPEEIPKALIDWEAWAEDPWRAAGKLAPDLLAVIATVGTAGIVKAGAAVGRLRSAADAIELAQRSGRALPGGLDGTTARLRARELGFDPRSPSGQAAMSQLRVAFGGVDRWSPTRLHPGQRIAFAGDNASRGFATRFDDGMTMDAREFFEAREVPPKRSIVPGEPVPQPTYPARLTIYEVRGDVDAATATALANPQYGLGGGDLLQIDRINELVRAKVLVKLEVEHHFDQGTLTARFEDPRFRAVDPSLPEGALDPAREARLGRLHAAAEEAEGRVKGTGIAAAAGQVENVEQAKQGAP